MQKKKQLSRRVEIVAAGPATLASGHILLLTRRTAMQGVFFGEPSGGLGRPA